MVQYTKPNHYAESAAASADDCCAACSAAPKCAAWKWSARFSCRFLATAPTAQQADGTYTSGVTPPPPPPPPTPPVGDVFDVTSFGAVGDGASNDTAAVRAAAAALAAAGGGELLFPAGGTYLTGAFNLSSHTVMRVEAGATVLGSTHGEDWPLLVAAEVWPQMGHGSDCVPGTEACRLMHQAMVFARGASNITITGGGAIDCNSRADTWWGCAGNLSAPPCSGHGRPHCIMLADSSDLALAGPLHVRNSPDWTVHFSGCQRVHVAQLNISNPVHAPNADGIDIDSSEDVLVEDCFFSVGDDALCVKSGIDYFGRRAARPARNILFRRNVIGTGHGITIGSEMSGGVSNVTFEDITMENTGTGIRLKSQRGRGGAVTGVTYRNIWMKAIVGDCVQVTLNYHAGLAPTNATATPVFRDVLLENVRCDKGGHSYNIDGLPEQAIEGLALRNVTMSATGVGKQAKCDNANCTCDALTLPCPTCCTMAKPPPTPARGIFNTWGQLATALNQTGASGKFTLSGPAFAMTGYTGGYGITISGSITIVGAGATIDAGAKGRLFYIPSADDSLTLVDLTLQNGHINGGGGAVANGGFFNATNCQFIGNTATSEGGAVVNALFTTVFRNCSFNNNTAPKGNSVWTHSPYSTVTFVTCDGTKVPMTDCCTAPALPTCPPTPSPRYA